MKKALPVFFAAMGAAMIASPALASAVPVPLPVAGAGVAALVGLGLGYRMLKRRLER